MVQPCETHSPLEIQHGCYCWKLRIIARIAHTKCWFCMAILVYQRVTFHSCSPVCIESTSQVCWPFLAIHSQKMLHLALPRHNRERGAMLTQLAGTLSVTSQVIPRWIGYRYHTDLRPLSGFNNYSCTDYAVSIPCIDGWSRLGDIPSPGLLILRTSP